MDCSVRCIVFLESKQLSVGGVKTTYKGDIRRWWRNTTSMLHWNKECLHKLQNKHRGEAFNKIEIKDTVEGWRETKV